MKIEIRTAGIDKGKFASQWICEQRSFDFVLALGDGKSDEDLFQALGPGYFTIKIGNKGHSNAQYRLNKQNQVEEFLFYLFE